ncbi:MAG: hydrogenase nickel incorporation protein HypB [Pirellulales bacterium]
MKIIAAKKMLAANDQLAAENRAKFKAAGVLVVNVLGSPGAGKTTLLEALLKQVRDSLPPAVIEGDIAGSFDAERIESMGIPAVQINTDGACHLDANMTASAIGLLSLNDIKLLFVENVGNLVCTAGFDLGEDLRIVVLSVSEGDDKVAKYPAIFQRSDAVVLSKTDLLPHTDFNRARFTADVKRLAPKVKIFELSAKTGEGVPACANWLLEQR